MSIRSALCVGLSLVAASAAPERGRAQSGSAHYHVVGAITAGRIGDGFTADFISIDSANRRLYGIGNRVIDIDQDRVVDSLPTRSPGGYALAVDVGVGLSRTGTLFDLKTLRVLRTTKAEGDATIYDPVTRRIFVLRDRDSTTVFEVPSGKVIARKPLAPAFESGAADGKGELFINREDSSIVTKVNARTVRVEARYPVRGCIRAQGLSMDRVHRRLFIGCDKALVVLNADDGRVVARIPVTGHADENAFDANTQLVFSANAVDSTLTVVHEDSPDQFRVIEVVKTGGPSRSVAVDGTTHKLYAFYYDGSASTDPKDYKSLVLKVSVLAP